MKKDDVVEVLSGKMIAGQRGACHVALDNGSTVSRTEFFDAPAERHISGAQVPKFLDMHLSAEQRRFVEPGGAKSSLFGDRGGLMNTSDPIIAAIEAHRRACAETRAAFEHQSAVENELVAAVRMPAGEAENDPQWIAANDASGEALAVQDDLAVKLLETQPTTIAGAAALLTYYVDVVTTTQPEVAFPELNGNGRSIESKSINEPRRDFAYFIVRNVAAALTSIGTAAVVLMNADLVFVTV
jgi:hypothetical protein